MPLLESSYRPRRAYLRSAHLSTITPALLRSVPQVSFTREVLEIDDGDFLDLDWYRVGQRGQRLVIVLHGLEGAADRPYVKGTCKHFAAEGWDTLALNQRTCGGRMNRLLRAYHMGTTDDLARVVQHVIKQGYTEIGLVGFSMGGNHVVKYLGENGDQVPEAVIGGVAYSVPCHIESANVEIDKWHNRLYLKRFLIGLNEKIKQKAARFPGEVDASGPMPKSFQEFDDRYTGPLHGFTGALDYWTKCSSKQFIPTITKPCLMVNAQNDTFLSAACYPREEAAASANFYLEIPAYGGHVGFGSGMGQVYWSEKRALNFLTDMLESRS